jgi:hypothetical protein
MKAARRKPLSLPATSDEMKVWSAALVAEVGDWPQVSARSFFGFTALYRKDKMFAALPRTRPLETANTNLLAFKLESPAAAVRARLEKTARPWASSMDKARWFAFELRSDADLHDALDWLGQAYAAARNKKSR